MMKYLNLSGFVALLILALGLVACDQSSPPTVGSGDTPQSTPQPSLAPPTLSAEEILQIEAQATSQALQDEPVEMRAYRSYPAPTGLPGFRRYYQKRCYPGCHSYSGTPVPGQKHP